MTDVDCQHLDEDRNCKGLYSGFGCIEDKCKDPSKGMGSCIHMRGDGYCKKLGKFHCNGKDCEGFESAK